MYCPATSSPCIPDTIHSLFSFPVGKSGARWFFFTLMTSPISMLADTTVSIIFCPPCIIYSLVILQIIPVHKEKQGTCRILLLVPKLLYMITVSSSRYVAYSVSLLCPFLILYSELVRYECDKLGICRFAFSRIHCISKQIVDGVYLTSVPRHLYGMSYGSLHP